MVNFIIIVSGVTINRDYDRLFRFMILSFHVSILVQFLHMYLFQDALSELLYSKIRIKNSLMCIFD